MGQNLGAKQYDRAKAGARFGILCSVAAAELIGAMIFIASPFLVSLFNSTPEVVAYGARQAHIEALFYCFLALSHCIAGVLRGAGKATVPMFIMLGCWCIFRVIYITVALRLFHHIEIVYSAYPITWTMSALIFMVYLLKADWLHALDHHHL